MSAATFQITIANTGVKLPCGGMQTILAASVAAGVDYPYGCASGNCGACISHLDAGKVSLLARSDAALSAAQVAAAQTLACRAVPLTDVTITWLGRGRR